MLSLLKPKPALAECVLLCSLTETISKVPQSAVALSFGLLLIEGCETLENLKKISKLSLRSVDAAFEKLFQVNQNLLTDTCYAVFFVHKWKSFLKLAAGCAVQPGGDMTHNRQRCAAVATPKQQ